MAMGGFGRIRWEEDRPDVVPASPEAGRAGDLTAFIDQGCEFEGKLQSKGAVRIDGDFRGEISSEDSVVVGETAGVEADIRSKTVIINGAVSGNVIASRQLVLSKTGRLQGSVEAPSLSVDPGALFNGQMKMVRPEVLLRAQPAAAAEESKGEPSESAAEASARPSAARSGPSPRPLRPEASAG